MSNEIFIEARKELLKYLKRQLVGPADGSEEYLKDAPHKRYLMGTLFPPAASIDVTDESVGEDSTTEALSNDFKPSSMALSFAVLENTVFQVDIEAGKYTSGQDSGWKRQQLTFDTVVDLAISSTVRQSLFDGTGRLDVTARPYKRGKILTVALSNQEKTGEKLDPANCLYQCSIRITVLEGSIIEYPVSDRFKLDEEQKELALTYRKRVPWAVGHGVSVVWQCSNNAVPTKLTTEVMPAHEVKGVSTDIDKKKYPELSDELLSIFNITDTDHVDTEGLLAGYSKLVSAYSRWIEELDSQYLDERYVPAKDRVIKRLRYAAERMTSGVEKLRSSSLAMLAFRLANKAMLMQMIHSGLAKTTKPRNWGYSQPDYYSNEVKAKFKWRPFQLAFQLLALESLIPDEDTGCLPASHEDVDLLWFPTGGGKTEAYLAVAAWEMIYRRLKQGVKGGGTAVIKRYTLRLLTAQQFQRAGSMICALEMLRQNFPELGDEPFSLGLWAGEGSTPNDFGKAYSNFKTAREDHEPENGFQLLACSWCGTEIMPKRYSEDSEDYGIRCNPDSKFEFFCPSDNCDFHSRLPIQVVDQALYANPPTLLIGTIDKFARLTWKAEASAFFGNGKKSPPSLVIQDELHLISGPLGTIAGIYEAGFDTIMEVMGGKPKVIAATATIRSANQQVNRLFGRTVNIFPPSGTEESDSFFSKEDTENPGRLYIGIMPSGHTGQTALVQAGAAVLQAPQELGFEDNVLDSYWTLPVYHNSRRELGKTITLARDDIPERIKVISSDPRSIEFVEELSAGVKGSRIPEVLTNLGVSVPNAIDILPCTNMISVGVDIGRLGIMIINGQPKATAEYIQASSRVGRDKAPGIVVTMYASTKPRDRSHYETFKSYHQALYRYVEPTSVTPWTPQALERALHAALVAAVRVTGYLRDNNSARYFSSQNDEFKRIHETLQRRIESAMAGVTEKERGEVFTYLQSVIDNWEERASRVQGGLTCFDASRSGRQFHPLIQSFETANHSEAWKTLNSMRNVDTETYLFVRGESND